MRRRTNISTVSNGSISDFDQVQQLVSRNDALLRNFLLIICGLIVFVIIVVFLLFLANINKNNELTRMQNYLNQNAYATNYIYNLEKIKV